MNDYGMTIIAGGREIEIPVLPQKLKVTSPGNNDKATVLVLGDILILRKKGLRTVAWDSFFPVNDAPFVTGRITDPVEIVRAIQDARDGLDPVRFLITGTDLDINVTRYFKRLQLITEASSPTSKDWNGPVAGRVSGRRSFTVTRILPMNAAQMRT